MREPKEQTERRGTSTSAFGVSRREGHDSSTFYARFTPPIVSADDHVSPRKDIDDVFVGDASRMEKVDDASVALVVTSPPYFAGKEYEAALGEGHIPATYGDYLDMLEAVFAECVRTLEPGGRIAVNVANLGRKPYRSLSADVTAILQDRLRLLLRGEVIWVKARGASGSCAWGSFQRPTNPVLRDLTERVVIASKGRFDRAVKPAQRRRRELPHEATSTRDEFMEATTDVWEMPSESASRVGHPAPFPVELPERLIHLHTFRDDLVLDPFMGSGTTAVAAIRTERHFVGYDTDPDYVERARARVHDERTRLGAGAEADAVPRGADHDPTVDPPSRPPRVTVRSGRAKEDRELADTGVDDDSGDAIRAALSEGHAARDVARRLLEKCGFVDVADRSQAQAGADVDLVANDIAGRTWYVVVAGGFTSTRPGLQRADVLWKTIGAAAVLREQITASNAGRGRHDRPDVSRCIVLTPALPSRGSAGSAALAAVTGPGKPIHDVIVLTEASAIDRLRRYARAP